jgi:hypothetical protein
MKRRIRTIAELAAVMAEATAAGLKLIMTGHPFDPDRTITPAEAARVIETETAEITATV